MINASVYEISTFAHRITAEDATANTISIRHGYLNHANFTIPLTGIAIAHKHYPYTVNPSDDVTTIHFENLNEGDIATIYETRGRRKCYFENVHRTRYVQDFDEIVTLSSPRSSGVEEFISSLCDCNQSRNAFFPKKDDTICGMSRKRPYVLLTHPFDSGMWLLDMVDSTCDVCERYFGVLTAIEYQSIDEVVTEALAFRIV